MNGRSNFMRMCELKRLNIHARYTYALVGRGFRHEGRAVKMNWTRGKWVDYITMAILDEEWEKQKGVDK
jgi:RimJ/RimL family protein N-acetyltransferase